MNSSEVEVVATLKGELQQLQALVAEAQQALAAKDSELQLLQARHTPRQKRFARVASRGGRRVMQRRPARGSRSVTGR
jgi:hypothetical protein